MYTCTQLRMALGSDEPTEPTLPCELSVVTVPSYIRPSKRHPSQRELHKNCEMPPCGHMGDALRGWYHFDLSPTNTLYPTGRYGSALAELNSGLTPLSARWCVQKVPRSGWLTQFQTRASSCPPNVGKTPTPVLRNPYQQECTEECTFIPDSRSVVSSSPPPKYPKRLLLLVLPHSHQEPLFPSQHMHYEAQHIYTLIYTYSSWAIKERIFKEGSARSINMH
jgi:hypothetical protein